MNQPCQVFSNIQISPMVGFLVSTMIFSKDQMIFFTNKLLGDFFNHHFCWVQNLRNLCRARNTTNLVEGQRPHLSLIPVMFCLKDSAKSLQSCDERLDLLPVANGGIGWQQFFCKRNFSDVLRILVLENPYQILQSSKS